VKPCHYDLWLGIYCALNFTQFSPQTYCNFTAIYTGKLSRYLASFLSRFSCLPHSLLFRLQLFLYTLAFHSTLVLHQFLRLQSIDQSIGHSVNQTIDRSIIQPIKLKMHKVCWKVNQSAGQLNLPHTTNNWNRKKINKTTTQKPTSKKLHYKV